MRSHIRAENIKAVNTSKPGFPYEPFDPGEFSNYSMTDYMALPTLPMMANGWRLLDKIPSPTEETWVSWITSVLRIFNVAENNGAEVGIMRHPQKPETIFFAKVKPARKA